LVVVVTPYKSSAGAANGRKTSNPATAAIVRKDMINPAFLRCKKATCAAFFMFARFQDVEIRKI